MLHIYFLNWFLSDKVQNESIQLKLTVNGRTGAQVEHALYQHINSPDIKIQEEAIHHGQMYIDSVVSGSVVLQLRPVTDHAVQALMNAKENNRLLEMITGMLENVDVDKVTQNTESLQIKVQVYHVDSATAKPGIKSTKFLILPNHYILWHLTFFFNFRYKNIKNNTDQT